MSKKKKQPAAPCIHHDIAMTKEAVVERHIGDLVEGHIDFIQFHFRFHGVEYSTHKVEDPWRVFWLNRKLNFRVDEYALLVGRRVMHLEVEGKGRGAYALIDCPIASIDSGHISDEQYLRQLGIYHLLSNRVTKRRRMLMMGIQEMRSSKPEPEPEAYRLAAEVVEDGQLQMEFESRAIGDIGGDSEPIEELII